METSRELVALGHEVSVLTGAKDLPDECVADGVRIISIDRFGLMRRTWKGSNLTLARQMLFPLAALSKSLDSYDIYHGHIYTSGLVANYLARRSGGVAVNTIHGSYYPIWHKLTNPVSARLYRTAERILAPWLAGISDIQLHTGDYFAQQLRVWGVPKTKLLTIHNGVDTDEYSPSVKPLDPATGHSGEMSSIDPSLPVILTARRLVKKNGIDHLIRAFARVLEEEQCQLVIIGDGEQRQALEGLAEKLKVRDRICFQGFVPHEQLPPYLALADIAVVPSLVEASSIFMLEAMAMGKPVIATNTGGLPEVLDRSRGMLVEPMDESGLADSILWMLSNREKRLQLGKSAREYVQANHSWKMVALQMESVYRQLLYRQSFPESEEYHMEHPDHRREHPGPEDA